MRKTAVILITLALSVSAWGGEQGYRGGEIVQREDGRCEEIFCTETEGGVGCGGRVVPCPPKPEPQQTCWEIKELSMWFYSYNFWNSTLKDLGNNGWELVTVDKNDNWIFKRPKECE